MELSRELHPLVGTLLSRKCIARGIRLLGLSRKRAKVRPYNTGTRPDVIQQRLTAFKQAYCAHKAAGKQIVAVDETGFEARAKAAVYGYSPSGKPVVLRLRELPGGRRVSVIMAVSGLDGSRVHQAAGTAVNGSTFASFLQKLPFDRGTVLLMDNAAIHKTRLVRAAAHERGYELMFVPPYSPDFNPIENVFARVKHAYRASKLRGAEPEGMEDMVVSSLEVSTPQLVMSCFEHMERVHLAAV
jgi:hypothetical protein